MTRKRKHIWAYLDGEKLIEVIQAALDNNMMIDDMKRLLINENPGHEVTFKVEGRRCRTRQSGDCYCRIARMFTRKTYVATVLLAGVIVKIPVTAPARSKAGRKKGKYEAR